MPRSIINVPTDRLEALSDGIYAIAMTLIILEVSAPTTEAIHSAVALNGFLIGIIPELLLYFLSFIILANFWYIGHIMYLIKKADKRTIYLNMLLLMFVVLVPFSTSLIISFQEYPIAITFFGINILVIEIIYYLIFYNAYKNKLLPDKIITAIDKHKDLIIHNHKIRGKLAYPLLIPLASILGAMINPGLGIAIYIVIPLVNKIFLDRTLPEDASEKIQKQIKNINE